VVACELNESMQSVICYMLSTDDVWCKLVYVFTFGSGVTITGAGLT